MPRTLTFRELVEECRRIANDQKPFRGDAIAAMLRRDQDGIARRWIVDCWIHGPEIVASAAESSLAAGCTPKVVAEAMAEAERRMTEYEQHTAAATGKGE